MRTTRRLAGIVLALLTLSAQGAPPRPMQLCAGEAIYGFPTLRKKDTTQICRRGYAIEYDNQAKIPIWGSYLLTPIEATGCYPRVNSFTPELYVRDDARATLKDYAKSGYDQGHMVNSADMLWDPEVQQESFILSNIAPQLPEFNRGIWKKLEDSTRGWTLNRRHPLQIYVGPIYNRDQDKMIGLSGVTVPHGFWKVIIDTQTNEVMVFKFNHEGSQADLSSFVTSLAEVQRLTGIILPMPKNPKFADKTWPRIVKSISRQKTVICSLKLQRASY